MDNLKKLCDVCHDHPGQTQSAIVVDGYTVQLRYSRPLWAAEDGMRYNTLDVVKIGWVDFSAERPRRGALRIWCALEEWCQENDVSLRVECVLTEKVKYYLKSEERGFICQVYSDDCFIKPIGLPKGKMLRS